MSDLPQRPPIASSPLSVILFAQSLSTETADALRAWRQYLDTLHRPYEILLIQETRPEVAPEPADAPVVIPLRPRSAFAAFNAAIQAAQHPLLAFCTCDKQYQPGDLDRMLKVIDKVDLVVGYRTGQPLPPWRILLDTVVGLFSRVVLGIPLQPRVCWLGSDGWSRRCALDIRCAGARCGMPVPSGSPRDVSTAADPVGRLVCDGRDAGEGESPVVLARGGAGGLDAADVAGERCDFVWAGRTARVPRSGFRRSPFSARSEHSGASLRALNENKLLAFFPATWYPTSKHFDEAATWRSGASDFPRRYRSTAAVRVRRRRRCAGTLFR